MAQYNYKVMDKGGKTKKGVVEEEPDEPTVMSGIPSRPYAKGRNYDPNRYGRHNTEE